MKYFTLEELQYSKVADKLHIDNTPPEELVHYGLELIELLDKLREQWGQPILVTSGYRSPELNDIVGGVKYSQHLSFQAADIVPKNGDTKGLFELAQSMIAQGELEVGQLIDENDFKWVHISLPNNRHHNDIKHL